MATNHFDVLIVGAGLSGIGAAHHLQANCPNKTYAILEARDSIGGTWDLFRYPGIRSDSDMYTLGFSFKPWTQAKAIADGPSIMTYLNQVLDDGNIRKNIRFGLMAKRALWSTEDATWTIEAEQAGGEVARFTCNFLYMCSGYYNYEKGYTPDFPGAERFAGRIVHPQKWTPDIDYAGKRVVVIGSGATAVTLVPEMAKTAGHVTMLQRSPTYIITRPAEDGLANWMRRWLPAKVAYGITRWKNVLLTMFFYQLSRRRPARVKKALIDLVRKQLGPNFDVEKHFTPPYNPWDQRVCLVPDGDLFAALRSGRASIATDHIETFTETGIKLKSGAELEADVIVTATGLDLKFLGGMEIVKDGVRQDVAKAMNYKGLMLSGVPNLAIAFGYTNASWTLKADLTSEYVCRLINQMDRTGYRQATPTITDASVQPEAFINFTSGYVQRALDKFPKQGSKRPWKLYQNYALDIVTLKFGSLDDGSLLLSNPAPVATTKQALAS